MRYVPPLFRPPSEAHSYILQATLGCSWNKCSYCDMYRSKRFQIRMLDEILWDVREAAKRVGAFAEKIFVADGDALVMPMSHWRPILSAIRAEFPRVRQVSCYAMAHNVLEKRDEELRELRQLGLTLLYIGPESGDDVTLKRIVKGSTFAEHVDAAARAHAAGFEISVIALLGAGGVARPEEHASATARLVTEMDPEYFAALTLSIVPETPLARMRDKRLFQLPEPQGLLNELRVMVAEARPTDALFRTNHASNYLPLGGRLPRDRAAICEAIDAALRGEIELRSEESRGL